MNCSWCYRLVMGLQINNQICKQCRQDKNKPFLSLADRAFLKGVSFRDEEENLEIIRRKING